MNQQNTQQQREQCHTDCQNNRNGNARISINKGKEGRILPITAVLKNNGIQLFRGNTRQSLIDNAEQSWIALVRQTKEAASVMAVSVVEDKLRYFTCESR